jgi:thioredoxin-related protein
MFWKPICRLAIIPLFATVFLAAGRAARAEEAGGIFWYKDIEKASEAALKENKVMMVDFWADWCAACKVMDAEVYPDPEVIHAVNENVISVKIHFDLQQELARKYGIPALPFMLFTNSYGTKLFYHRGILEKENFVMVIKALPKEVAEINRLDRGLQEDKNNSANLLAMGAEMRKTGFYESSSEYYNRALKQDAVKKDAARRESAMFEIGKNALQLQNGKVAAETFEKCLKDFPKSANRSTYLLGAGQGYALDEKKDKARKTLSALVSEFPQSENAGKAQELLRQL